MTEKTEFLKQLEIAERLYGPKPEDRILNHHFVYDRPTDEEKRAAARRANSGEKC